MNTKSQPREPMWAAVVGDRPPRLRTYSLPQPTLSPAPHAEPSAVRPTPVAGANWQPGVIAGSECFRVFLGGEPVVGTFAARAGPAGWVDVTRGRPGESRGRHADHAVTDGDESWATRHRRVTGEVRLVRCRAED